MKRKAFQSLETKFLAASTPLHRQADIPPGRGEKGQRKAKGIGPEAIHELERIDHIAPALGHLLAELVPDQGMDIDVPEGDFVGEVEPHHDHPRHPEEENVEAGHEQGCRIETRQVGRLFGPPQGGKGPEGRREPGIENVGIPGDIGAFAGGADRRILPEYGQMATGTTAPGRNPVAPPYLPRNAPVADVVDPFVIGLDPGGREEADLAGRDGLPGPGGQGRHPDEPL